MSTETPESMIIDKQQLLRCFHDKQNVTMRRLMFLYGGDLNAILNALHEMAARLAISTGVDPEVFSDAVKHHWDHVAECVNTAAEPQRLDS